MHKNTTYSGCTLLQIATDHAFTGTYVQHFRMNDPPEAIECPCGAHIRSAEHIIHLSASEALAQGTRIPTVVLMADKIQRRVYQIKNVQVMLETVTRRLSNNS